MNRKALTSFATSIVLIGTYAALASAQTHRKVTLEASVPFEFVVGNRVFPAGSYVFEMATGSPRITDQAGVLVVHSRESELYAAVATGVSQDANSHVRPKLVFLRNGDGTFLSRVWRQGNVAGLSVHAHNSPEAEEFQQSEVVTLDANVVSRGM